MTEATEQRTDHGKSNGSRWYDPHRVTLALFGVVSLMVIGWSSIVYSMAHAAEIKNASQDEQLKSFKETVERIEKGVERVEVKVDRVIEQKK